MKIGVMNKVKLWIVITLAVVAVGMFVLGFVGVNNPVDYKTSYQVEISTEEDINGSLQMAMDTAEDFFKGKGISAKEYSFEVRDNGSVAYKFDKDVSDKIQGLEALIQSKLNDEELNLEASVEVSKTAITKAGDAVQDFSEKSVIRIDIKKLESKLEKLINELGSYVFDKFNSENAEFVNASDEKVASIINNINEVKSQIASKTEELEKKD